MSNAHIDVIIPCIWYALVDSVLHVIPHKQAQWVKLHGTIPSFVTRDGFLLYLSKVQVL